MKSNLWEVRLEQWARARQLRRPAVCSSRCGYTPDPTPATPAAKEAKSRGVRTPALPMIAPAFENYGGAAEKARPAHGRQVFPVFSPRGIGVQLRPLHRRFEGEAGLGHRADDLALAFIYGQPEPSGFPFGDLEGAHEVGVIEVEVRHIVLKAEVVQVMHEFPHGRRQAGFIDVSQSQRGCREVDVLRESITGFVLRLLRLQELGERLLHDVAAVTHPFKVELPTVTCQGLGTNAVDSALSM